MNSYGEFFLKFMEPFFGGIITIFKELFLIFFNIFNILYYVDIIKKYIPEMDATGILIVSLAALSLIFLIGLFIFAIYKIVMSIIKFRHRLKHQSTLVEEINTLNNKVIKLENENNKLLELTETTAEEEGAADVRFAKLTQIDNDMENYQPPSFNNEITLEELANSFLNFSASRMGLYYNIDLIRLFIAAFASNRLIILQGISGTGKTSLAYAWGRFIKNDTVIASVQPSWRDSSELFGYFNEFTKKFNETEVLTKMYESKYKDNMYLTLLDEMNISRVEYYFAEMLSILELPVMDEWVIDLVPSGWPNDPVKIKNGRLTLPSNMWYIGTINNDDSTFMITDKVYDRAMPINIDDKGVSFDAPDTDPINFSSKHLNNLFEEAFEKYPVSQDILDKIELMDDYVIDHFRLAFGNRIVKQLKEFVPAYVATGGEEMVAIDYLIAHKILRKFEQLNLSYIRDEIDGFIDFLNQTFGNEVMKECIKFLNRLKKRI